MVEDACSGGKRDRQLMEDKREPCPYFESSSDGGCMACFGRPAARNEGSMSYTLNVSLKAV